MAGMANSLIEEARRRSGLTQDDLAQRAGTSRPTLSAYEHGRKSPTLETADRLVGAAGFRFDLSPRTKWSKVVGARGQVHYLPDHLLRLTVNEAFASFKVPLHLDWSRADRRVDLADRAQRVRWYEVVLREGTARDIERYVDGALLVEAWSDIVLPRVLRTAWQRLIDESLTSSHE
jgi:transcriptional regulator with XRE-family HTH domain